MTTLAAFLLLLHVAFLARIQAKALANAGRYRGLPRGDRAPRTWPSVAVLVPARNEERAIGGALETLLRQDYPGPLRVVVANDHSTDSTGAIARRVAAGHAHRDVDVFDVPELPPGWMGKNHALHRAVARLGGSTDLYLFTDADVHFAPDTIRRAVCLSESLGADLLVGIPEVDAVGAWENILLPASVLFMLASLDPRRVEGTDQRHYMGVGAFNLIRRSAYERFGGHRAIRGEVLDDVALGMMTKQTGGRVRLFRPGGRRLHLRMYTGLSSMIAGFSKNAHAAIGGGPLLATALVGVQFFLALGPLIALGLALAGGSALVAGLAAIWTATVGLMVVRRAPLQVRANQPWLSGSLWWLGLSILGYILARSSWLALGRGEIHWRGRRLARPEQKVRLLRVEV